MKLTSIETIFRALNDAGVRYLVAGGLAVNAHGYLRLTNDVDLVVALDPENIVQAFKALATLGYKPLVPITAEQFADPALRRQWIDEKGMKVLNFFSDRHRETTVICLCTSPSNSTPSMRPLCRASCCPACIHASSPSPP